MNRFVRNWMILGAVILASCDDTYQCGLTTTVHDDGTFSREYALHLDSAQLVSGRLDTAKNMVVLDSNWQLTWGLKGDSARHPLPVGVETYRKLQQRCQADNRSASDTIVVYATRSFDNAESMARNTHFKLGTIDLTPSISMEKSYRFFHTTYQLKERYPQLRLHLPVPLSRYFTKEEIGYWFDGSPDLGAGLNGMETDDITQRLKEKYTRWVAANDFELTYRTILDNYARTGLGDKEKARFRALHDSLLTAYTNLKRLEDKAEWFGRQLNTDTYAQILDDEGLMAKVEAQENTFLSILLFNVDYRVEMDNGMPIVVRKLTGTRLIASDELFDPTIVRSHWSAYAFTLLLIVGTLISLAVLHRKKRQ